MFQACFQRIQRPRASSVSCDGFFDCLTMHPQSRPHARDVGAMASSFAARRADTVDALFAQVVERVVGVQAGEENLQIAHNYCLYHTRHHSFPDPDPRAVRDEVDALRERLGVHAQLEKQRALEMLVGRFEATPWADVDVPDVQSRVMLLLLRLSGNPLQTKYTHVDAARAVGDADATGTLRGAASVPGSGFATRARERGDRCDDDATESEDDASVRSASTLSDWSDDEETVSARADAVRRRRRRRAPPRAARAAKENERPRGVDATNETHESSIDGGSHTKTPSSGFSWRALGDALDAADAADARETRETRGTETKDAPFVSAAPPAPRRGGAGEIVVHSASRLFPRARRRARGRPRDERARGRRGARGASLRGGGRSPRGRWRRRGDGARRRRRWAPRCTRCTASRPRTGARARRPCRTCRPTRSGRRSRAPGRRRRAWTPPGGWRATLDPNAGSGPTLRAAAAAASRVEQEIRDALAPLLLRAAGLQSASTRGAPTLLELRASTRVVSRARARCAPSPTRRWRRRRRSAGARRLRRVPRPSARTRPRRAAATRQTSASDDGQGFVDAARLFCAAAQPYLGALHRWVDSGELEDPAGELFVRLGSAAAEPPGTEAHWHAGFQIRRGRLGAPECPEFLGRFAEELLEAGKTAGLLRARAPVARNASPSGGQRRNRAKQGVTDAVSTALPPSREHLGAAFCLRVRAALEGASGDDRRAPRSPAGTGPVAAARPRLGAEGIARRCCRWRAPCASTASASLPPRDTRDGPFAGTEISPLLEEAAAATRLHAFSVRTRRRHLFFRRGAGRVAARRSGGARAGDGAVRGGGRRRGGARTGSISPRLARAMARPRGEWGLGATSAALRAIVPGRRRRGGVSVARVAHARLGRRDGRRRGRPGVGARVRGGGARPRGAGVGAGGGDQGGRLGDAPRPGDGVVGSASLSRRRFGERRSERRRAGAAAGRAARACRRVEDAAGTGRSHAAPRATARRAPARARAATESHATRGGARARRRPGGGRRRRPSLAPRAETRTSSRRSTSTPRRASWRRSGANSKTRWRARRRWRRRARRTPRF